MSNQRNFALDSNSKFGCTIFGEEILYAIQSFTIPGMTFSNVRMNKRSSTIFKSGDTIMFDSLTLTLILDSELNIWRTIAKLAFDMANPQLNTISDKTHEAWIEVYSSASKYLFTLKFHNVLLESIGTVPYLSTGADDELTVDISFNFSHYTIHDKNL
jgi:hypothetical protein